MELPTAKGVNLGGWLVLEKWMTPSLFEGLTATDETSFCLELGEKKAEQVLRKHWKTFITQKDFDWIAKRGLQTVRIPIAHWIFGDTPPYASGGIEILDKAIQMAENSGLKVIIDLHAVPGSQNGWDHSGLSGKIGWHKDRQNIEKTLEVLHKLAQRYANAKNLWAIELINEPHWEVPLSVLSDFYKQGYEIVREHLDPSVAVIISDAFRPDAWKNFMSDAENVILDMHMYQCFDPKLIKMKINDHLKYTKKEELKKIQSQTLPVLIGEWSLGLEAMSLRDLNEAEQFQAIQDYGQIQLEVYGNAAGWNFWNYTLENRRDGWNFRHAVETGMLPNSFANAVQ